MKLITFGDSWVWGDELEETYNILPDGECEYNSNYTEYRHLNNIGGVVNSHYDFSDYINYATNGGSNEHIIYDLINYINSEDYDVNDLILVGLTSPMRHIIYNNISKTPLTWPGWDYDSYMNYCDEDLRDSKSFENWWKGNVKCNLNNRNDILKYTQSCLSIKSLLSNHKKYLVWQSIDSNFWKPEEGFAEVYLEKYNRCLKSNSEVKEHNILFKKDTENFILKKENLKKELNRGTSESQSWINLDHKDWKSWLEDNFKKDDVFVWSSNHPNKKGINLWYEHVLKEKILKILKLIQNNLI